MSHAGPPTARAIYRFYRDCGEAAWAILLLALADHLATVGPALSPQGWLVHVGLVHYVLMEPARREAVVAPPRLVTGDDLMEHLGLGPGPTIGRLLERVREAQAEGKVSTREEALALARRALKRETRGEEAD
jgi:poly(A) polymerase